MSAQIRIMTTAESDQGFGLLKDIVDMVKNPKAIDAAYEARKKAAALSDEEVTRAEEARKFMEQADSIKSDLKKQYDDLASQKSDHDNTVSAFSSFMATEKSRLTQWEIKLNSESQNLDQISKDHVATSASLDAKVSKIDSDHSQWEKEYNEKVIQVKETEKSQEEYQKKLIDWENRLKSKAERLTKEASSD